MDIDLPVGKVEARSVAFNDLEVTKQGRHFDGYAAIYGEETDLGEFIEVILPPAFRSALSATSNLPMLWDHNAAMPPFATTKAGTLKVTEDRRGLRVSADIDERHILGPTLISMAERGEVDGMSFGFMTGRKDNKVSERNGRMVRAITGFKHLLDVSPTWNPAYSGTTAELRSLSTLGASVLVPEQIHGGEPQSVVDGPEGQEDTEQVACEECGSEPCACVVEEQRSGVDADASAARRRRLQMMGLSLPGGER
jgi:HK97 family phage prohead protease